MPQLTTSPVIMILVAVMAYLIGSIPFGILITRAMGLGDLRQIGSGNIGATNVLRTGNKGAAAATLILDAAKGTVAVLIARIAGPDAAQLAALCAFLGHLFPVWLKFKGGKGVATFLGTLFALDWHIAASACATWLVVALVTRISSLAALSAAALSSFWLLYFHQGTMLLLIITLTLLIYWKHWPNLQRIKAGTEPKIGAKPT